MLIKVAITVAIVATCYAQHLQPQLRPNQATSFQSFIRKDVPIVYQFSAVHSTPSPTSPEPRWYYIGNSYDSQLKQKIEEIQYAPLLKPGESYYELHSKSHMPHNINYNNRENIEYSTTASHMTESKISSKDYLEPKLKVPSNIHAYTYGNIPYVPELSIQTVSRSPGHNAVYRKYTDKVTKTEATIPVRNKIPLMRQVQDASLLPTVQISHKDNTGPPVTSYLNTRLQPNIYNSGYADFGAIRTDSKRQLMGHPKTNKILLNLSRTYNIKKIPCKSHMRDCIMPNHAQSLIGLGSLLPKTSDINTALYTLPHKHNRFIAFENLIIRRTKL